MSHFPDRIDERHIHWIYGVIGMIEEGKLAAGVLSDFAEEVGPGLNAESEVVGAKAARILSWIAVAAGEALENLPVECQSAAAAQSESWPVVVRPKVVTAVQQIEPKLKRLRFAEGLWIDLNHSARSADGRNVPVEESREPGIGLALALQKEIISFKASAGLTGVELTLPGCTVIEDFDPNAGIMFEDSGSRSDRESARHYIVAARVHLHLLALVAKLGGLTKTTVNLWSLTAVRWLQHQNRGALVYELPSNEGPVEYLSSYIRRSYWEEVKAEAVSAGKTPSRLLEVNIQRNLRNGFRALAKS